MHSYRILVFALVLCGPLASVGLAATQETVTSHPALDYFPSPSQDGRYLAFVSERAGNPDIWLKSLSTGAVSLPRQLTVHPSVDQDPALNANASKLLYISHKTDPRGDVYVMDLITGEDTQLTDLKSGDSSPRWTMNGKAFLYLKEDVGNNQRNLYRRALGRDEETEIAKDVSSFAVNVNGELVYSRQGDLYLHNPTSPGSPVPLSTSNSLDLWPAFALHGTRLPSGGEFIYFTRYEEDTNHDGLINAEDESSIWMYQCDLSTRKVRAEYRVTASSQFHLYPAATQEDIYFSDLQKGDVVRVNSQSFLGDYASFSEAKRVAARYIDAGNNKLGLVVLTNISRNLASRLPLAARAEFDFSYVEELMRAGKYSLSQQVLAPYTTESGEIGALAQIHSIVLDAHQLGDTVSVDDLRQRVDDAATKIITIGETYRSNDKLYGQALIEAGRLHLLANDPLSALEYLIQVDSLNDKDVRAKALFSRGTVYRKLGDDSNLRQVFVDVISLLGEDSSWGRRATTQAIAVAEQGQGIDQKVASLQQLAEQYPNFPFLATSTRLHIASLYDEQGEQLKALNTLDRILASPPPFQELVERSYRHKAEILSASERYQEAADAYAALGELTGENQAELSQVNRLMVRQLVRKALKDQSIGETRIAAKAFKRLSEKYPETVEAHRGYIATKAMLNEISDVQAQYRRLVSANPDSPMYLYAEGLALSYSEPPNIPTIIQLIQQAIQIDPSVSYFHQTLGWAYEQQERLSGAASSLEQAENAYRVSLALNNEFEFPDVESNLLLNLGNTYVALHNFPEAYHHYREREKRYAPRASSATELLYRKNYGAACFKTGRSEESIIQYRHALAHLSPENPALKAELLERIGLSQQDLGKYSQAVESFSQALEINLDTGNQKNLALLQRNIGVNLYNLSTSANHTDRHALKQALKSYFTSLERIQQFGVKEQKKGVGLLNLDVALGDGGSQAAGGFDRHGEEKLMFSYIAGTYEKLSEPGPAREYYLRKLSLISEDTSSHEDVSRLTEKAIVLNRIGILSDQLGLPTEALHYMRQSLGYTQTLDLPYGTGVNLYNISRLLANQILSGEPIDLPILETLVTALDDHVANSAKDTPTFFALTTTAFLLSTLPQASLVQSEKIDDHIGDMHSLYALQTRPWSYYTKAQALVEHEQIVPDNQVKPTLVALKLNMLELARGTHKKDVYTRLQEELLNLVEAQQARNGWLWHLAQAEQAGNDMRKKVLLKKAFDTLMSLPPQVSLAGDVKTLLPAIDRLTQLSIDLLVNEKDYQQAFSLAERLSMRKIAMIVHEKLGESFELKGLGDYEEELRTLFIHLREELAHGNHATVEEVLAQLEEVYFGIFEEYPHAASFFWQYLPEPETFSAMVSPAQPYLRVIAGADKLHGFLHDGTTVRYLPLEAQGAKQQLDVLFVQLTADQHSLYLSLPEELSDRFASSLLPDTSTVRVNNIYDIINAYYQRSLFYANIAITGSLNLATTSTRDEVLRTFSTLTGDPAHDRPTIQAAHVVFATTTREGFAFEVKKERQVREMLHVQDMMEGFHHTIAVLNPGPQGFEDMPVLISSLIRAGFPHLIVNEGAYDQKTAEKFTSLYLTYLADLPPYQAVATASAEVFGKNSRQRAFTFYGYAGMDEDEKVQFASSAYTTHLENAVAAYKEERFHESLENAEHALSVITYTDKIKDFRELTQLAVDAAFRVADYHKAVFHQEKLLRSLGGTAQGDEKAEVLYRLGVLYSRLEQWDLATQHLESAIAIWTQAEELDRLAEGVATLGVIRENMGSYSGALADFARSFELFQEIGEIGDVAMQYRRIGRIYYLRLGRYEKARENFVAALESYREVGDEEGQTTTLYEIGLTYEKMGLFQEANKYYQDGKQLAIGLDDSFLTGTADLYLANTAWFAGNYQQAFESLSRATRAAEAARDPQLTIMVENTRGLMYWTLNDTDKGLAHLKQAVSLAKTAEIKTELASSLNNLGLIYRQQQDYATSLTYFEEAKDIDIALNSQWGLGYDYRNIGMSLLKLGKLTEAEDNFLKAEHTSAAINNVINWVKAILELGNVNRDLQRFEKAMEYYQKTYKLATHHGIQEVEWRAAEGIATIFRQSGKRQEAFEWYAKAIEIVEGMRASLKIDELRNSFQSNKVDLYKDTIGLLVNLGRMEDAFNYLERSRSRSFIDLLGNQKLTLKNSSDQNALDKISTLSLRVHALKTEIASYEVPPDALLEQYRETKALHDEAVLELKETNPGLSSFVSVDPLTQAEVEQMLEPGVALLSYMLAKDKGFVWIVRRTGTSFHEIPTHEPTAIDIVTQYRQAVQHLEPVDDELEQLYNLLIQPVRQELNGVKYLGIIPDGPLHFLSFAALKNKQGYLIDQFPLFYAPSASVLKFTFAKRQQKKATKVLAVGNPDLGNYNYDLPLAELEAKSIQWNYPDMDILTGRNATKEWFVDNIGNYGIIHLAAHGEFDEFNPLFSSLWLASERSDNRRLTVSEVFGLEINADLVTLSACQTGLGKLEAGELIGLNRAFIYAGTHALVSALWRVDDLSTSVMMKHFYRNYVSLDKAKSLRQAQLIVKKEFPHPSYWAGFSLVGDYQ